MDKSLASRIRTANAALIVDGKIDTVEEFFGSDYVVHLTNSDMKGLAAVRSFVDTLRSAFGDLGVDVEVLVEHGDRVAWQRTLRGTHRESFRGFPPSGRPITWRDMLTTRFRDGMIVEEWAVSDLAEHLLRARRG